MGLKETPILLHDGNWSGIKRSETAALIRKTLDIFEIFFNPIIAMPASQKRSGRGPPRGMLTGPEVTFRRPGGGGENEEARAAASVVSQAVV